jgi:hypothetical protein
MKRNGFEVRGLELHSYYAWDYEWIMKCMDFMQREKLNTLILHRNDFVDLIIYPGRYFGCEARPFASIFERYSEIFRKLYKYTPTRRSSPYQRRAFFKRVLEEASRRNISVYVENKELYFPDVILEFYPELVHDGHICATDPFWLEFLKVKYTEFFEEFPECAGIITAPATGESRVSIKSNRCTCPRCQATSKQDWFKNVLEAMYEPIHKAGKTLVVRDFVFDPSAHAEIASVMENLPEDVVISLKNTPHDYFPTFPDNKRIGHVGNHSQWIEYDAMGQYFGWGVSIADLMEDYRRRFKFALSNGAEGFLIRTDWESLDGHTVFRTPNLVNLYSAASLAIDTDTPGDEIYRRYLENEGMLASGLTAGKKDEAVKRFAFLSSQTWQVTKHAAFVNDVVFSDSSLMPISYKHAFWLAEEKNSLKDWSPDKAAVLAPEKESVVFAMSEKEECVELAQKLLCELKAGNFGLTESAYSDLVVRYENQLRYASLFRAVTEALVCSRYLRESKEDDPEFREKCSRRLSFELSELEKIETELRTLWRTTSFHPHTVYTLLDPDRVSCLRKDLIKEVEDVQ